MGQKFAAHDAQGCITAYYDSIDSPVPPGVVAIAITDDQWQDCINAPGAYVVRDSVLGDAPPPDPAVVLAAARESVRMAIRLKRDSLLPLTPFDGCVFQTDAASQQRIMGLASARVLPDGALRWRTADNTYAPMTLKRFVALRDAILARECAVFSASAMHQEALGALATPDAVQTYDWRQGWPD